MLASNKPRNPARYLIGGFLAVIVVGSLLLGLPVASQGEHISYLDALFTATSAVCLTGLVVVDTGTFYSTFGHVVIMLLIFTGSLGFMTMATLIFIFLGRRISLRDRLVVKEALNQETMANLVPLVKAVVSMTVLLELLGAALLCLRFVPLMGWRRGVFFSLFHAISAFGNAGFDLFGGYNSLTRFPTDYLVNGTILVLFIIGGLGFTVVFELARKIFRGHRLSLHTRMVVIITAILLLAGTAAILALEYHNPDTMGSLTPGEKVFTALFTAAAPRSSGFRVLNTGVHPPAVLLILMALMFIGAAPASTGGGVKITTFGVVVIAVIALIRGQEEPVLFERRLSLAFDS
ncbi:MAG TPA: potassium transporter TrkG [Bacillota bacterium]|nr:potassium transporter TrkG [Bacillota bacterium]